MYHIRNNIDTTNIIQIIEKYGKELEEIFESLETLEHVIRETRCLKIELSHPLDPFTLDYWSK